MAQSAASTDETRPAKIYVIMQDKQEHHTERRMKKDGLGPERALLSLKEANEAAYNHLHKNIGKRGYDEVDEKNIGSETEPYEGIMYHLNQGDIYAIKLKVKAIPMQWPKAAKGAAKRKAPAQAASTTAAAAAPPVAKQQKPNPPKVTKHFDLTTP